MPSLCAPSCFSRCSSHISCNRHTSRWCLRPALQLFLLPHNSCRIRDVCRQFSVRIHGRRIPGNPVVLIIVASTRTKISAIGLSLLSDAESAEAAVAKPWLAALQPSPIRASQCSPVRDMSYERNGVVLGCCGSFTKSDDARRRAIASQVPQLQFGPRRAFPTIGRDRIPSSAPDKP